MASDILKCSFKVYNLHTWWWTGVDWQIVQGWQAQFHHTYSPGLSQMSQEKVLRANMKKVDK